MKGNIIGYILLTVISFGVLPGVCQSNTFSLTGKVTDKESGLALEGISVYINNTTYSTQTDKDGSFRLAAIPLVNFELIFSAVNYETQTMRIDSAAAPLPLNIRLRKNTATLNEVVVTAAVDKNGWAQYGSTFTKDFLSYSAFAKKCVIVNYQAIRFRRIKKDNILKAYSKEPLKIRNEALGYELIYWLDEYEHQFARQVVFYKGNAQFTEMKGGKRKTEYWNKNRQMAYEGSLTHFIRSVYEGTTAKEGFVVNLIKTVPYKDINLYIPAFTDTTSIHSAPALTKYIESLYQTKDSIQAALQINKVQQWLAALRNRMPFVISLDTGKGIQAYFFLKNSVVSDQISVYRFDVSDTASVRRIQWETAGTLIPDQKTLSRISGYEGISADQRGRLMVKLFYSRPLNTSQFVTRLNGNLYLKFDDTWQVTYRKERKDKEYIEENALQNNDSGYQESTLSMVGSQPVMILPNGYYIGTYSLITGVYWSYEKIDKMLPLDFKPSK
jgi:hypothetical protein